MRFAVALVTLLIAGVLVAAGLAQRTIFKPADHVDVAASIPSGVRYVVVPGAVLKAHPGGQSLHLAGSSTALAAYGKPSDVTAWLSGERYAELRVDEDGKALAPVVRTAPRLAGVAAGGSPDPDGSDLWVDQRTADGALNWKVSLPSSQAMLVAADGAAAAPSTVRISWPVRTATPFAIPLIAAGAVLAVIGLLLYVWALVHVRRTRGPRRKPPAKLPKRPAPPKYRPHPAATAAPGRGRRSTGRATVRRVTVGTAWALGGLLAAGAVVPGGVASAQPAAATPTAAVSQAQARRIVERVAKTVARADAERSAEIAGSRVAGPALELRAAAYRIKKKSPKAKLPLAIPTDAADMELPLIVPQATTSWPRTLFVVVHDRTAAKAAPQALALVQDDPRSDYKLHYAMALESNIHIPTMPSALVGATRLDPGASVLRIAPEEIAPDYGALLRDDGADSAALFDVRHDELIEHVGEKAKKKAAKRLGSTAGITFKDLEADADAVIALSTAAPGALVAVDLHEQWTVKPKRTGVTVRPSGGTRILSKTSSTAKGIASVYGYQLLFSVPSAGSKEPAVLLGYAQGLVSAKEL